MLINNITYNCVMSTLATQSIETECYDREYCDLEECLKQMTMISKLNCGNKTNDKNNKDAEQLINNHYNKFIKDCLSCKTNNQIICVHKDDSLEYYACHPNCCPLPLWQVVKHKIEYNLNIKFDIKNIKDEMNLVTKITSEVKNPLSSKILIKDKNPQDILKSDNFGEVATITKIKNIIKSPNLIIKVINKQ